MVTGKAVVAIDDEITELLLKRGVALDNLAAGLLAVTAVWADGSEWGIGREVLVQYVLFPSTHDRPPHSAPHRAKDRV